MYLKRGLVLVVFLLLVDISLAQDQCLLVNENNVEEAANRIWNTFSNIKNFENDNEKILEAALSAVDSLKLGDNVWYPEIYKRKI